LALNPENDKALDLAELLDQAQAPGRFRPQRWAQRRFSHQVGDGRPRAVVTGGLGFIGSHLLDRLEAEGFRLLAIDTDGEPRPGPTREWLPASVTDPPAARAVERFRPRLLVHAAAQTQVARSVSHPLDDARTNVMGTLLMLEAARAAGVRGFLFISSAAVYGAPECLPVPESHPRRPLSPYGLSKLAATSYVEYYGRAGLLPAGTLIPANVYGPGQTTRSEGAVVPHFLAAALSREPLHIDGDGRQTRDFLYVDDLVEAVWLAWQWLERGGLDRTPGAAGVPTATFNIGTATETSIACLADMVESVSGRPLPRMTCPPRPGDIARSALDSRRAWATLGWKPQVALADGLRVTCDWWRSRNQG